MESRVGSLALTVRAPAGRVDALAPVAQMFTVRILSRCDELLESQAPGRVVLVRQLELSLRLIEGALGHEGELEAFAREIAEVIDSRARAGGETPSGDPEIAVFEDEIAWRAAHLEARAAGLSERMWCFEALEADDEPTRAFGEGGPTPQLHALLTRLRRRGTLRACLAALPAAVIETLAERLGMAVPGIAGGRSTSGLEADAGWDQPPEAVAACLPDLSASTPLPLVRLCVAVAARDVLGLAAPEEEIAKLARAALTRFLARAGTTLVHLRDADDGRRIHPNATENGTASAFGGLFFLLNPALELSVAETLWRACLPEGLVLTRAAAKLLGAPAGSDAAPALFGGASPHHLLPDVSVEQQTEVSLTLLTALRDALPRRSLAPVPEVLLRLVETPAGRLLAAAEPTSPYAIFAFPARSPDETQRALDAFLEIWPASAPPPRATRALAELDRRARVRPAKGMRPPAELLLAEGESLEARALVTQVAGSLGHVFAARGGVALPFRNDDLVADHLSIPAQVLLVAETMEIRLPMKHLSLDVRRAGLDADPGWVPWLGRRVTFTYEEEEDCGARSFIG